MMVLSISLASSSDASACSIGQALNYAPYAENVDPIERYASAYESAPIAEFVAAYGGSR